MQQDRVLSWSMVAKKENSNDEIARRNEARHVSPTSLPVVIVRNRS